jgi:tRNA-dihydrouridine synthase
VQLLVTSAKTLEEALAVLEEGAATFAPHWQNIRAVDLNFGCPSPDVIKRGAGPAMIKRRSKLTEIFSSLAKWKATTSLDIGAVGAKIRLGLNAREQQHKVYLNVADIAVDCGLDYLTVHARHGLQRSRDPVAWEAIGEISQRVRSLGSEMAVLGNGDVKSAADVRHLCDETGCAGVMLGRAAIHNPWVFRALTAAPEAAAAPEAVEDAAPWDAGGGGSGGGNAALAWPSAAELDRAEQAYGVWGESFQASQRRFQTFHAGNFNRIREGVLSGAEPARARAPSGQGTTANGHAVHKKRTWLKRGRPRGGGGGGGGGRGRGGGGGRGRGGGGASSSSSPGGVGSGGE